jgi:hypothetical protein
MLARCPISHALSATVTHTIDVDLVGGNAMQRADLAATDQTMERRG